MKKKLFALMTALLIAAMSVMPILADPTSPPTEGVDSKYEELAGGTMTFDKYLITNEGQIIPNLDFTYTIAPGKPVKAAGGSAEFWTFNNENYPTEQAALDALEDWNNNPDHAEDQKDPDVDITHTDAVEGTFEIQAGIMDDSVTPPAPTVSVAQFGEVDPRNHQKLDEIDPDHFLEVLPEGTVYSRAEVTVNLGGVKFTEPGVYRYIITENMLGIDGMTYDIEADNAMLRVLDVYVTDDPEGTLKIAGYVLHKTKTEIKTTEEMGSKDEKIVASKWSISGYEDDQTFWFDSKEAAEARLAEMKSTDDSSQDFHDESIVQKQAAIDAKKAEITAKEQAKTDAENALSPTMDVREQNLADAQAALKVLTDGTDPAPTTTIQAMLDSLDPPTGDAQDAALRGHGRDKLQEFLVNSTDRDEIVVLRRVLAALATDITNAENDVATAQAAVDDAKAQLKAIQDQIDALNADLDVLNAEMDALVERHNNAEVVEIEWTLGDDKSDHYTNRLSTYNLVFGKEVTGNQGSKDKYFKFTLKLGNLTVAAAEKWTYNGSTYYTEADARAEVDRNTPDGEVPDYTGILYTPEIQDTVVTVEGDFVNTSNAPTQTTATIYNTATMNTANTRDDVNNVSGQQLKAIDGEITWDVYLKDGSYIVIKDLPEGATYEITEAEEDYRKTSGTDKVAGYVYDGKFYASEADAETAAQAKGDTIDDVTEKLHDDPTSGTLTQNVFTGYTNTRNGVIPTGVAMSVAGGAVLVGLALVYFVVRRRREEY